MEFAQISPSISNDSSSKLNFLILRYKLNYEIKISYNNFLKHFLKISELIITINEQF